MEQDQQDIFSQAAGTAPPATPAAAAPAGGGRGGTAAAAASPAPAGTQDIFDVAADSAGRSGSGGYVPPEGAVGRAAAGVGRSLESTGKGFAAIAHMVRPPDANDPVESELMDATGGTGLGPLMLYRLGKALYSGAKSSLGGYREAMNQTIQDMREGKLREAVAGTEGLLFAGPVAADKARELAAGTRPGADLAGPVAQDATDLATMYLMEKAPELAGRATKFEAATAREMAGGKDASAAARAFEGPINRSVGAAARDVMYGSPAQFLIDNKIPYVSRGPQLQAVTQRLNELVPQLQMKLAAASKDVDAYSIIDGIIKKAGKELDGAVAAPEEIEAGKKELDLMMDAVLKRNPSFPGTLTASEANEVKQAIGDRVNFRARQELKVPDAVDKGFRKAYGALREAVNEAAPGAAELNGNVANGIALRQSLMEAIDRERAGQGGTTATGSMTVRGAIASKVGRVAPRAILAGQSAARAAQAAAPAAVAAKAATIPRGGTPGAQKAAAREALSGGGNEE